MTNSMTNPKMLMKMMAAKVGKGDCTEEGISGEVLNGISSSSYL